MPLNIDDSAQIYTEAGQKSKMKLFSFSQKIVKIPCHYIEFPMGRIKIVI